ncbi:E3 ubiquitin-protein ligase, ATL family [Zostera marina]|uniref:E3 ubiquitin-protein ligase, ATL family n=1 Tax=Zostera marina TaxID=29655 RepID=A0A0K9PPK5_ZOSMR|nr:E3 ubiquitin-protein ligase, ATL family [Zostera marina]
MDGGSGNTSPATRYIDERIGGVGYGIGLSFGILSIITTIALASYFCTRNANQQPTSTSVTGTDTNSGNAGVVDVEMGLDEETIKSYPNILYHRLSTMKLSNDPIHCSISSTAASACSICLSDYDESDLIRILPDCKHLFHLLCVDPWLRLHPTCPVCRMSLISPPVKDVLRISDVV